MEENLKNSIDNFLSDEIDKNNDANIKNVKKVILNKCEGLIERFDPIILIDESGRQLLREQY